MECKTSTIVNSDSGKKLFSPLPDPSGGIRLLLQEYFLYL